MKNILEMNINEMAGMEFDCSCGRHHKLDIQHIAIGKGVLPEILPMAAPFKGKKILMVSDDNTFAAAGQKTFDLLKKEGHIVKSFVFKTGKEMLIPDEKALGRLFMEMEPNTALIVAVGSGSINDMCKYMSARTGVPYIIVCTAPSMDGYASDGAPMICNGFKISFVAKLAYGIVGDTDIMKDAPMRMIQAGFGDVLGKATALAEWKMARELVGEYYCDTIVQLVEKALKKAIDNAAGLAVRDEMAIQYLIEALTLTGVAMGLCGVSRPASGAEHMLSHYWEMYYIAHNRFPEFHGIKVGIATPIICQVFELLADKIPAEAMASCPSRQQMEELLKMAGAPVLPTDIGIERALFRESLIGAWKVRSRYSVLQLAVEKERINEIADIITERIYG
ncbi:MAG: sn-glycerol-1-phosphate dehydrogenase [Oscillospiraceae bacterium]|nr:sn-glycerol-1-phosphate dehydrogenase [Oscillospiraceae bacterium]